MEIVCSNCQKNFNTVQSFICPFCGYLNALSRIDFFSYLGLEKNLDVNLADLETKFLNLMSKYHPDNFVSKSSQEKINAQAHSVYLNNAYETLKEPTLRFIYLYELANSEEIVKEIDSNNPALFIEFLEYYEELENIKDNNSLKAFQTKLQQMKNKVLQENAVMDFTNKELAYNIYLKLQYIDKIIASAKKAKI
ncbi:MAG: Fe-S protein assembly co-chaperone HscB [Alphaproteobacteria bacterium]|jgi:molecular chaperone HscB|nr:Fe-S protein assembly co-chaperone HscB [Alphaproteobacteria bacterium]